MRKSAQLSLFCALLGAVLCAASLPTQAQVIDPSDLFTGNGTSCLNSTSCAYVFSQNGKNEVIGLNGGTADLFLNGGGQLIPSGAPLLLIIGIPNPPGGSAPSITSINGTPASISALAEGSMSSGDIYGALGLAGDNSNSFTNWTAADCSVNGLCGVTSFSIFEYVLTAHTPLNGNGSLTFTFSGGGLPQGTFVVGWGCEDTGGCTTNGTAYSTPFTQAGLVASTPEPSGLGLLGLSLLMLGGAGWWRTKQA